jgi:hypothetical protein
VDKSEWRRALAYLWDDHLGSYVPRGRRRHHFELSEERYTLQRLAEAVDVMRFASRHRDILEREALAREIDAISSAGQRVAELDQATGIAKVLAENRRIISSELTPEDLPPHDRQFLEEAGTRDPDMELMLGIERLKDRAQRPASADERGMYRGSAESAVRKVEEIKQEILETDQASARPPDRPPRRPFKGLGGIGKGFGLVIADSLVLVEWPVAAPEAAKAGALASFALGWDGILSGLGDLRGE